VLGGIVSTYRRRQGADGEEQHQRQQHEAGEASHRGVAIFYVRQSTAALME
jgi:hypothetical protein